MTRPPISTSTSSISSSPTSSRDAIIDPSPLLTIQSALVLAFQATSRYHGAASRSWRLASSSSSSRSSSCTPIGRCTKSPPRGPEDHRLYVSRGETHHLSTSASFTNTGVSRPHNLRSFPHVTVPHINILDARAHAPTVFPLLHAASTPRFDRRLRSFSLRLLPVRSVCPQRRDASSSLMVASAW